MPRRKDSFARALSDAQKRLDKALAERAAAQTKLGNLANEIPRLQMTIAALQDQTDPIPKVPRKVFDSVKALRGAVETIIGPPPNLTPEELAKWYVDRDLSSVGSIVPERPATPAPQSEEELLPDDFAVGKKE